MTKGIGFRFGSIASAAITAVAMTVQTGLAAVIGVVLAREFGRGAETDGFFAAYSVYLVSLLAAGSVRVTVLPVLARAERERRLAGATASYAVSLALIAGPLLAVSIVFRQPIADLLTGLDAPPLARDTAATVLPWMVLAALAQLYAGLFASALAALDDYVVAAIGFAAGSVLGLAFILWRVGEEGVPSIAWGMALNGGVALALPAAALALRARAARMPPQAVAEGHGRHVERLAELTRAALLPLSLQALYLVSVPFAAREGVGAVTSFGYAYLFSSAVVGAAAASIALVTSVPLSRVALGGAEVERHVAASSWLALAALGAAAGIFALAGGPLITSILGSGWDEEAGGDLGRLIVVLSAWGAAAVAVSVTYPLLLITGAMRGIPLLAVAAVGVHVALASGAEAVAGLDGLAVALAATTSAILVLLLAKLGSIGPTLRRLGGAAVTIAGVGIVAFTLPSLVLGPALAASVGVGLYVALIAGLRPPGLVGAWRYLRTIG